MKKKTLQPVSRSPKRLAKRWQKWKRTPLLARYRDANEGVAAAIAAVMLLAILTLFAFFMNVGGMLLTRSRLETMAELGAAGGGRVVAEEIAYLASNEVTAPPSPEDKNKPEKFLKEKDLILLQNDADFIEQVKNGVRDYAKKNKPSALNNFDAWNDSNLKIIYPYPEGSTIDCAGGEKTLRVYAAASYNYPYLLGKISEWATGKSGVTLSADGIYSINACE